MRIVDLSNRGWIEVQGPPLEVRDTPTAPVRDLPLEVREWLDGALRHIVKNAPDCGVGHTIVATLRVNVTCALRWREVVPRGVVPAHPGSVLLWSSAWAGGQMPLTWGAVLPEDSSAILRLVEQSNQGLIDIELRGPDLYIGDSDTGALVPDVPAESCDWLAAAIRYTRTSLPNGGLGHTVVAYLRVS